MWRNACFFRLQQTHSLRGRIETSAFERQNFNTYLRMLSGLGHTRMDRVDGLVSPRTVDTIDVLEFVARAMSVRSTCARSKMSCAPVIIAAWSCAAVVTTVMSASASAAAVGVAVSSRRRCVDTMPSQKPSAYSTCTTDWSRGWLRWWVNAVHRLIHSSHR